jgi:hypothetical protein
MPTLRCEECVREVEETAAVGWRAFVVSHPEVDDSPYRVTYCPECARREFGDRGGEQTDV